MSNDGWNLLATLSILVEKEDVDVSFDAMEYFVMWMYA